jgi:hypothetical protein
MRRALELITVFSIRGANNFGEIAVRADHTMEQLLSRLLKSNFIACFLRTKRDMRLALGTGFIALIAFGL